MVEVYPKPEEVWRMCRVPLTDRQGHWLTYIDYSVGRVSRSLLHTRMLRLLETFSILEFNLSWNIYTTTHRIIGIDMVTTPTWRHIAFLQSND